ncbi:protein-L-isoaspartate(D-aspartate) O-methyltransferase [Hydrogenophaga sp.]|uniref:protein-L-isoaspartate(D-aspartate) O-methyltransferase n=1 Tax=Hydrogenophaga sp. TaxID=1904254 RepID=UPI0019A01C2F|nr:protein-L-isoaspartate(D-aspartate) O-methyltransferase [Hydrogenophaga sp.]MBD3893277.1 protein-L-isoaspartate(D-aspartate) O-methyltransferase [Hydrogenophaga sp.]
MPLLNPQAQLLRELRQQAAQLSCGRERGALDERVLAALAATPRERFVPAALRARAHENHALPIGHGQTISQPFIVALMTDLLATQPQHVVLEIGTGSGYQAAILARLVKQVYSLEIIAALASRASQCLRELGLHNVEVRAADGHAGLAAHAPYDGIIVTAAATNVPAALLGQLKPGARLVAPIGLPDQTQTLTVLEKQADGSVQERRVLSVVFVPLTGADAPAD